MLARAVVSLRKAQALMRHSTPTLTANIYTQLTATDLVNAVERLPSLCQVKRGTLWGH
jgi:hypothetical protein